MLHSVSCAMAIAKSCIAPTISARCPRLGDVVRYVISDASHLSTYASPRLLYAKLSRGDKCKTMV